MKRTGFGLVEVVIASGILAMVAGATLALSNTVLKGTVSLADRTTAQYLGVEALEVVRQVRDTNLIDEDPATIWSSGITDGNFGLVQDPVSGRWRLDAALANQPIIVNNLTFNRTLQVSTDGLSRKRLEVVVSWDNGRQTVRFSTILTESLL